MDSFTPSLDQYVNSPAPAAPSQEAPPNPEPMTDEMVNVINPGGELVSVSKSQLQSMDLLNNGYSFPSQEEFSQAQNQKDYGGLGGQINAAAHQLGKGLSLGAVQGWEDIAHLLMGEPNEILHPSGAIEKQVETNPISAGVGTGLSLVGGLGTALEQGVVGSAQALSPIVPSSVQKAVSYLPNIVTKIGSATAKAAAENAIFQSMDEADKAFAGDPNQTVDTALSHIGASFLLGGALGGGFAVVPELWHATAGPKVSKLLNSVVDHAGGIEGHTADAVNQAFDQLEASGRTIPPEIRAIVSDVPKAQEYFKDLRQNTAPAGIKMAKTVENFRNDISNGIPESLGLKPEDIVPTSEISKASEGQNIALATAKDLESSVAPLAQKFEEIKEKKANIPLIKDDVITDPANPYANKTIPGTTSKIADQLGQLSQGWASDSDAMKIVNQTLKRLPEQETIGDLGNLQTRIQNENYNPMNPGLNRDMQSIVKVIRNAESDATVASLTDEAPGLVAEHEQARADWHRVSDLKDDLQSKLNLKGGNKNSNEAFIKNIRSYAEENPEAFLTKISNPKDAYLSKLLQENFPNTAQAVKDYQMKELLAKAAQKTGPNQAVNPTRFFNEMDKLSPELRNSLFSPEMQKGIESNRTLWETLNQLDKDRNFSNTSPTWWRSLKNLPGAALGMIAAATGHNPFMGYILGQLSEYLGHNAPAAAKLSFLKMLGSNQAVDSGAFKVMADFIRSTGKGESALQKGVKGLFQAERLVIPGFSSDKEKEKLDQTLAKLQTNPRAMFQVGGSLGHYLPEHQTVVAQRAATISSYLNAQRPQVAKLSPLDSDMKPTKAQQAAYDRTLEIAENPLTILPKIKEGMVQPKDLVDLKTMYPGLYTTLSQKLTEQMMDHVSDGKTVPYDTRMGLSLFLGQPLDSTMTPQSIQMAQSTFQQNASPTQKAPDARGGHAHSMKALQKISEIDTLPSQARQMQRMKS